MANLDVAEFRAIMSRIRSDRKTFFTCLAQSESLEDALGELATVYGTTESVMKVVSEQQLRLFWVGRLP